MVNRARRQLLQDTGLLEAAPLAWVPFGYLSQGPLGLFCFVLSLRSSGAPPTVLAWRLVACHSPTGLASLAPRTSSPHFLCSVSLGSSGISFPLPGGLISPAPSDPKAQSPTPPVSQGHVQEPGPSPLFSLFFSSPRRGCLLLGLFLSQELSQGQSSMVPEPNHGAVSLWKTTPHGERIWGFGIFFGSGFKPSIFVFLANSSRFQLLLCCVFIGTQATPDYESGLDVVSCAAVISLGLGFLKKTSYLICVNNRMEQRGLLRRERQCRAELMHPEHPLAPASIFYTYKALRKKGQRVSRFYLW